MSFILLQKNKNESELDYHKRLIYGKLVDKTLSDVDYSELSESVYKQSFSSDVARRMMYGSKRTLDLLNSEIRSNINDNNILTEMDKKIIEQKKERQKLLDQRREYNKLISTSAREDHLLDVIKNAANNLPKSMSPMWTNTSLNKTYSQSEAILILSDWHYGQITNNIFNTYNIDICKKRIKNLVNISTKHLDLHSCKKLHIIVLGDLYHGAIHTSARVASEELVCDQIMQVSELLAQTIEILSHYVEETIVSMTYGNHARTIQNKKDSIHKDNMEKIIPWWLKYRLKNQNNIKIQLSEDNEFIYINCCNHGFCMTHGDNDNIRKSPKVLYTLYKKKYNKDVDYIIIGDKHHEESFEELGVKAIICGCLCGTDDYANEKRLYSSPSQLLLIVDEENGVNSECKIKV